jgi:membrane-bound serine protease (ClpP class)
MVVAGMFAGTAALAQSDPASADPGRSDPAQTRGGSDADPVVVIEVGDPMDQRAIDYVEGAMSSRRAHLIVLKVDSPGVSSGDLDGLLDAIADAPSPVVAWVGPSPAVAFGGAANVVSAADVRSAAPGASVGFLTPAVHRGPEPSSGLEEVPPDVLSRLLDAIVTVDDATTIPGLVDRVDPALGQLILSLDGVVVERGDTSFTLDTAAVQTVDGREVLVQSRPVAFIKPGLIDRFLRLAARPETAFLFLVIGLAFAAFEFYAAGTGLMAFVASLSFILAGYGLATLPIRWVALVSILVGTAFQIWGFIQNRLDWRAGLGTTLVLAGGLWYTTTRPQYPPAIWMVVLGTAASVVFIWYALTSVVRGRFATPTVGREELLGRRCLVVETLDPTGVVVVDGARWQATADRGVEITAGAPAEIVGVTGLLLEVDPVVPPGGPAGGPAGPSEASPIG